MLDDDMKLEALPQTNNIKSIVTLEDKTDLERKGKQSEQGYLCVRFICFREWKPSVHCTTVPTAFSAGR